jgi:hypothetical protein
MNVLELAWQKKTAEMQRTIPHDLIVLHQRPPPNVVLAWRCTPHTGASDSCLILDLQKTGPRNSPKTLFWHHVTLSSLEILGSWRTARYRGEGGGYSGLIRARCWSTKHQTAEVAQDVHMLLSVGKSSASSTASPVHSREEVARCCFTTQTCSWVTMGPSRGRSFS